MTGSLEVFCEISTSGMCTSNTMVPIRNQELGMDGLLEIVLPIHTHDASLGKWSDMVE